MTGVVIFIALFIINLIFSLLQLSFFGVIVGNSFSPNLVLALSLALVFVDLDNFALMSLFLGGLMIDLLSFNIVGISSLTMVVSVYTFLLIRKYLSKSYFVGFLFSAGCFFVYDLVVGNLTGVLQINYLIFILFMLFLVLVFYFLFENLISYLSRSGIKIENESV